MGKRSWFSAVKKAVTPSFSKVNKDKRSHKSKSYPKISCHGNQMSLVSCSTQTEATLVNPPYHYPYKEEKEPENEQIKHVDSVTYTITTVEEKEDMPSQDAPLDVNCITSPHFLGKSMQEITAVKIQTAFRGYLARKDYRRLKARRRLRVLIRSQAVKRQTASTITTMQTMTRVQSQIRSRRIRMAEVNEALQRQLHQRREKELHKMAFDLSPRSKEQVDASLLSKQEAAKRREKALAYAYSHQQTWRNSPKAATFTNPNYFEWGWSWSEQWNVVRPWETGTTSNREPVGAVGKRVSHQSPSMSPVGAVGKRVSHQSPSMSLSKVLSSVSGERLKSATAKGSTNSMKAGLSRSRSGEKGASNSGTAVGSTKKRNLSFGTKKSLSVPRKNSKTVR